MRTSPCNFGIIPLTEKPRKPRAHSLAMDFGKSIFFQTREGKFAAKGHWHNERNKQENDIIAETTEELIE